MLHIWMSLLILLTGCTPTTHHISSTRSIAPKVIGENLKIILNNGDIIQGTIIEVRADSAGYLQSKSSTEIFISIEEINRIFIHDHTRGALKGALRGAIVGTSIVAFLILVAAGSEGNNVSFAAILSLELILGGGMALLGFIFGGIGGHTDIYKLESAVPNEYIILEGSIEKAKTE